MHRLRTLWTLLIFLTGQAKAQTPVTTIHTFGGPPDGANPSAGVVAGRDGVLYGTTANGGLKPSSDPYATNGCADNTRQFRMTTSDLSDVRQGVHVHFESIGPDGRTITENSHVGITNP